MKTFNRKHASADRLRLPAWIYLMIAVFLSATWQLPAQPRHFNMPGMIFPGGGGGGGDSSSDSGNSGGSKSGGPWVPSEPLDVSGPTGTNGIELSFQGANVDMVAQWLAQTTGKTVIKHPQVQCQITIMSSKKVSKREAVNMIYRALALEGYSAVELSDSIMIVPAGQEPRMSPEVVSGSLTNVPAGRQLLVKVFTLKHIQADDVRERIQTALSDKATVDVDEHANQIIVTDYNDNLRVVSDLIDALDSTQPEDVAVRVLPLKNIAADELAREMEPLYEKVSGHAGSKSPIDVAADDRSNSLIVLSTLADYEALENLVASLDTENAQEKTTRTFVLQNADAQDVAKQLQDLNNNQTQTSRYAYYFGSSPESNPKKIQVVADRRRNALIIQAPPSQMDSLATMIQDLDQPVSDDSLAPEIFPLKYVSASDMEDVLNDLFLKKTQQRSYWDFFSDDNSDDSTSSQDAGRLYGKVRITSEPYSNAIIVTSNSKENLAVVENVLHQLDQPSQAGESTLRIRLKYAKADTVANAMNILFAKNGSPALRPDSQQNQNTNNNSQEGFDITQDTKESGYYPWLGGQPDNTPGSGQHTDSSRLVSDLVGRVRCVSDQRGNALLVSANVHFFPEVLQLIQDVDSPSDKVAIEARIVQVSSDFLDQLGVRWSPDSGASFSANDYEDSFIGGTSTAYQQGFGGNTMVNNPTVTPTASGSAITPAMVAQTLANLRSGMVSSSMNIDFLVQFLHKNVNGTVLGEPSITIDDNETGQLFVGQEVPIPANTQISSVGSQNTAITYKDVGVVLEVTPHINSDGDVQLKIHAESSTVDSGPTVLGGDVFDTDNFHTEVTAKNTQTLVLGGIIQKQISDIERKVPVLGDIPGLGWAFKKKDKSTQEVELLVFLRPVVVHTDKDASELQEELRKKTPLLDPWRDDHQPKTMQD